MSDFKKIPPLSILRSKSRFVVLLLVCLSFAVHGQKRIPYEFKNYTITEGLPENTVYGCLQDSKKYMWFFTPAGASRFDGRRFENFKVSDNLSDNEVLGGFEDTKGRVWFKTLNGRLSYFNTLNNRIVSFRDDSLLLKAESGSTIVSVIEKQDGHLVFQSNTAVVNIGEKTYTVKRDPLGIKMLSDKKGNIYVSNVHHKAIMQYRDELTTDTTKLVSVDASYYSMCLKDSSFYIALKEGIYKYTLGDKDKTLFLPPVRYRNKFVTHVSVDADDNLWVGTSDGVYRFNTRNLKDNDYVFTGAHVTSVVKDHEMNYWVTTLGKGVLLLPYAFKNVKVINKTNGLTENEISAIKRNKADGQLIFSAYPNTIYTYKNGSVFSKSVIDTLDQLKINKLEIADKDLWFITQNVAVNRFKSFTTALPPKLQLNKNRFPLDKAGSDTLAFMRVPFEYITSNILSLKNIFLAKDKSLYLLNWSIYRFTPFDKTLYDRKRIEISNFSRNYAITESEKGMIWYGGIEGIGHYNPSTDVLTKLPHLKFESTVNDMVLIGEDKILVTTSGAGVYFVKDNRIVQHWQESNGLSSDLCNRIAKQDAKNFWVGTSKGVTHIRFDEDAYDNVTLTLFGGKNTNPATYINDLVFYNDTIALATNAGLYFLDVSNIPPQYSKPIVKVVSPDYYLDDADKHYSLPYSFFDNTNRINLQFQTIAFLNGEDILYTYQLFLNNTSLHKDSILLNDKFILPLTSLTTGNYKIIVTAKRTDGVESDPLELYFKVSSPIWKSGWATLIYLLAFGGLVYFLSKLANKRTTKQQYQLIKQKEENVRLEQKAVETNKQKMTLEQESLRASIDPHFIFNCLNNMLSLVYDKDFQSLKAFLPQLARLIRTSLQLGKETFISIETEKNYLTDYLTLEKMRFENKFDYAVVIDNTVDKNQLILPPLMLQIFVENAIKHGFKNRTAADQCYIAVHFTAVDDMLRCIVADNGVGIHSQKPINRADNETEHKSMGLDIVRKRIEILNELYKTNIQLSFKSGTEMKGTTIILDIRQHN